MEIHAHTHTARKKWHHYFWEFFMLFLAVTAGFFVENLREGHVERHREKQFIRSIAEDLKLDIKNLDSLLEKRRNRQIMTDSLTIMLGSADRQKWSRDIYYYARWLTYFFQFINNDRTIQQLKNSGNFRLIYNQEVSDQIMAYDQQNKWIEPAKLREEVMIEQYMVLLEEMFDSREFDAMLDMRFGFHRPNGNPRLLISDSLQLRKLLGNIHFLRAINIFISTWLTNQKQRAERILQFINSEYGLREK